MLDPASLTVQWPTLLWLLTALPLLVALTAWKIVREKRGTLRYAGLSGVAGASGKVGRFRRYLPQVLMILGLAALIVAVARPQAALMLPARVENIILAMDVSGSMRAADIKP